MEDEVWSNFLCRPSHPSTFNGAPPLGRIRSRPMKRSRAALREGWGGQQQTVRLAGLQIEPSPVCPVCLCRCTYSACCPVPGFPPEGFLIEMRFCCSGARRSLSAATVFCAPPPTHLLLPHLSTETPGARRAVTIVSGMPGSRFPGLYLHLSDTATGISSGKRDRL